MCVAAIAWLAHPRWRLVAIGNRDELHSRLTSSLAGWDNGVIAGRDLEAGGTWLGVHPAGRFALVTNYRAEGYPRPEFASRGGLVTGWLEHEALGDTGRMNPFNLFAANRLGAAIHTNYPKPQRYDLERGIHGLSNGAFGEPWPKTRLLEAALSGWLEAGEDDPAPLFAALADRRLNPMLALSGPTPEFSGVFIANPLYGTRASTVVMVDADGRGRIIERGFGADGLGIGEKSITFDW
ncbi:NRDE family protein [Novosphingobium sp. B 225]|uniref:NRDE family protein n=1 Tax=Novosphingobium sp. B 225 TaxID=1961849 RepID=UPI000B4B919B|nr:NRDE family protein [Novosphingobium sp. B 225]